MATMLNVCKDILISNEKKSTKTQFKSINIASQSTLTHTSTYTNINIFVTHQLNFLC